MSFEEISVEEAQRRLAEFHAIDVRAEYEFRGPLGHVPGAKVVPLPELEARVKELPTGRPLLLICRSGVRSGNACDKLAALGIESVVNLGGGMIAWNQARLSVEHVAPATLAISSKRSARSRSCSTRSIARSSKRARRRTSSFRWRRSGAGSRRSERTR